MSPKMPQVRRLVAPLVVGALCLGSAAGCKQEGVHFLSVNPATGRPSGGEEVRVRGSGFRNLGSLEVRLGGRVAQNVGVVDDETLQFTTPECREADHGQKVDLFILTNEGRSYRIREAFTCRRPEQPGTPNNDLQRRL